MIVEDDPENTAAGDDPTGQVPVPLTAPVDRRTPHSSTPLTGPNLAIILTMAAVIGLMLGALVLAELLT